MSDVKQGFIMLHHYQDYIGGNFEGVMETTKVLKKLYDNKYNETGIKVEVGNFLGKDVRTRLITLRNNVHPDQSDHIKIFFNATANGIEDTRKLSAKEVEIENTDDFTVTYIEELKCAFVEVKNDNFKVVDAKWSNKDILKFAKLTENIIDDYARDIIKRNKIKGSWKYKDENGVLKLIKEKVPTLYKSRIQELESKIENFSNKIKNNQQEIVVAVKNRELSTLELASITVGSEEIAGKFITEMDRILENEKIEDVKFEIINGELCIKFTTVYLGVFDPETGKTFEGNEYEVTIYINSCKIVIKTACDTHYKGMWSETDPHPHVNGKNGSPCLGNIDLTLSNLFSENEYYALSTIILGYLEAVNIKDGAGRYVYYRNVIDPQTHRVIAFGIDKNTDRDDLIRVVQRDGFKPIPEEDKVKCPSCEVETLRADLRKVYKSTYDYVNESGVVVTKGEDEYEVCKTCVSSKFIEVDGNPEVLILKEEEDEII